MHSMPSTRSQGLALRDRTNAGGSSSDSASKEEAPHESEGAGAGAAAEKSTPAPESSPALEPATPATVPMPTKAGLDHFLGISDGLLELPFALGSEFGTMMLKKLQTQYDQVQHHIEQKSFAPSDFSWWCCAVGRICEATELLKRGLDDATVLEEFAAKLTTVAQQPSDAQAAIEVVVLGEEVHATLGQSAFVTPAHLDALLPLLVDVCRALHQSRSDELPKLQSCVEAVLQAKQACVDHASNTALSTGLQLNFALRSQGTHVDQADTTAWQDQARRTLQLTETLLEKRAELDAEIAKGKRRELMASVFRKLGFELPQLLQPTHMELLANPELRDHDRVDWEGGVARLLHASLGYEGNLPTSIDGRHPPRSIHAVQQLLAYGVSPDAEAAFRPALLQCHVQSELQSEPACAKLLLRAGATITQGLANRMAPTQGHESETRLLVERALEPWSPANHELFPDAARRFAVQLLLIGQRLAALPNHSPLASLWLEMIMPAVVDRDAH